MTTKALERETPEELLLALVASVTNGEPFYQNEARQLIEGIKGRQRDKIVGDVNRAERPTFATGEDPDLVVRTTRSIDLRLIKEGDQAPYYVAPGKEDPDRMVVHRVVKGREYFRTRTGLFGVLVEQVLDEKAADWSQVRFENLPEGLGKDNIHVHNKAVESFVGTSVTWTGERTADGYTFVL